MSEAKIVPLNAGIQVDNLRIVNKGRFIGGVDLTIPAWHLTLLGCMWMRGRKGGGYIVLPCRSFISERSEKRIYVRTVEFTDGEADLRFQTAALAAVHRLG